MATMDTYYNLGSYGYMGVGPTPNRSFTLTVSIQNNQYYYRWYSPENVTKIGILLYKIGDTTKYAVHKTAYLTVTEYGVSYIIVDANVWEQENEGIPGSQTLDISYNESDWDFFGGFTVDDLKGAAMCFFVKDPSGVSGSAPNGTDYASIGSDLSQYIKFNYTEVQERFASTIDGSKIYANRAECDKFGNPISTTYATKSELAGKQDVLTAGENITIDSDGVISAAGGGGETYTAGTGIDIDSDGVISADLPEEEEVEFEELDLDDYQKKLTEGTGIDIDSDGVISADSSMATKSYVDTAVQGKANSATTLSGYGITDAYTKTQVDNALNDKQNSLTGITDVQVVQSLPASPVATVLYLIPEV